MIAPLPCPGCGNTRPRSDGWYDPCAPSWVRILRCVRELHAIQSTGRDIIPDAVTLAARRHRLDVAQMGRVLTVIAPQAAPAPVMPLPGRARAERRGAAPPWRPLGRLARAA